MRTRTLSYLLALGLATFGAVGTMSVARPGVAEAGKAKKKAKKKKAPVKKVAVSAEQKKARAELMGSFSWGMSKDEVISALSKQLDERYAEKIADTTDVYKQDQLRKEKAKEIKRVKKSFVSFEGKKTGWDVSIIDEQFAHGTDESMIEYWENQGGKNQRRFFFFADGQLYKMFIQIDTTQFPEEQQGFDFFSGLMKSKFGGDVADAKASYEKYAADQIFVKAVDKTKFYDAFCLIVIDPGRARTVNAVRVERIKKADDEDKILKQVTDGGDDTPDLDANKGAVDGVIKGK